MLGVYGILSLKGGPNKRNQLEILFAMILSKCFLALCENSGQILSTVTYRKHAAEEILHPAGKNTAEDYPLTDQLKV